MFVIKDITNQKSIIIATIDQQRDIGRDGQDAGQILGLGGPDNHPAVAARVPLLDLARDLEVEVLVQLEVGGAVVGGEAEDVDTLVFKFEKRLDRIDAHVRVDRGGIAFEAFEE